MRYLSVITALLLFTACISKESVSGEGTDPLAECVITECAEPGKDAFIQWNGFEKDARITLRGADGSEYDVRISIITDSGLIFQVPSSIFPGIYTVILTQGDVRELGNIEILESDIPVGSLDFPLYAAPGDDMFISGTGFNTSHSFFLKSGSKMIEINGVAEPGGYHASIPSDTERGIYSLWLSDGSSSWLLTDSFTIAIRKRLVSVSRIEPYDANMKYRTSYTVEYEGDGIKAITYATSIEENGVAVEDEVLNRYILHDDGVYRAEGGKSSSNNFNFGYTRDSDGQIVSADVLRYSRTNPDGTMRQFLWKYDQQGRPTNVTFVLDGVTRSIQIYFYENGNLIETNSSSFVYDDENLVSHPFAVDAAHAFDMMANTMEPFLYAPLLTGEHPFASRLLPTAFKRITGATSTQNVPFSYEYDEDGYVRSMKWDEGNTIIVFDYNNI